MRRPYAPAYEAYTHFGASAEDASAEDASAEEAVTAAITARKKVIRNARLGAVWGPVTPGLREKGKPERKYRDLTFESDGETHTLQLEYIANGAYNTVYGVKDTKAPLILRVSIPPGGTEAAEAAEAAEAEKKLKRKLSEAEREAERERREEAKRQALQDQRTELKFMRRMGKLGIGPRVYATVVFADAGAEAGADAPMTGLFTEKLAMSLSDAESCPYLTRRTFVDADAESALVDLYARSSRVFECIDTKSPNVLFTPGHRVGPDGDARIAMIDMDPSFCRDAGLDGRTRLAPKRARHSDELYDYTTIGDLDARLSGQSGSPASRDHKHLDSACISLLIHCVFSRRYTAYGFPYARVAACLYNNWDTVWDLVFNHETIDHRNFDAVSMVGFYYYMRKEKRLNYYDHKNLIRDALAKAIRAPMTRLLLMTRGLDVDDRNQNHDRIEIGRCGTVVRGDMYVRLARVSGLPHGHDDNEMRKALQARNKLEALDTLARNRERSTKHPFRCRASVEKGAPRCCHDPGDMFCDTASSVRVGYNDAPHEAHRDAAVAKEMKWQDLVYLDRPKRVEELDEVETARFLCHCMRIETIGTDLHYYYRVARNIYKHTGWTGAALARMTRGTMIRKLTDFLIEQEHAARIVDKIKKQVQKDIPIRSLPPCQ